MFACAIIADRPPANARLAVKGGKLVFLRRIFFTRIPHREDQERWPVPVLFNGLKEAISAREDHYVML